MFLVWRKVQKGTFKYNTYVIKHHEFSTQVLPIRDNWQMMFETAAIGMMMMMRTVLSVHQSVLCPSHCHISPIVFLETSATAWCGSYVSANDVNDDNEVEAVEHVLLRPRCDR